jgi:hypothetical protein
LGEQHIASIFWIEEKPEKVTSVKAWGKQSNRQKQKLAAGNQPSWLLVVSGPVGTHEHIFLHFQDHCVLFSSSLDLPFNKMLGGWSF